MDTYKFSPSQLRDLAAAKESKERGEPVQWAAAERAVPLWSDMDHHEFLNGNLYRPAPAPPQPVPWSRPEHIPIGVCYFREVGIIGWCVILSAGQNGFQTSSDSSDHHIIGWEELRRDEYEHSLDRETWLPCTHLP